MNVATTDKSTPLPKQETTHDVLQEISIHYVQGSFDRRESHGTHTTY
jgi:hypothetical protein